jgi:hypothetical protein
MTVYERKSVWVSKIDTDKATKLLRSKDGEYDVKAQAMAVINTAEGVATVCDEGVGWFANDEGKYMLLGYYGAFHEPSFMITAEELISIMSDEFIYLDEFVRSFGARLETNYDIWYGQANSGPSQQPHAVIAALEKCLTPTV